MREKIKVGIEVGIGEGKKSGVGVYVSELLKNFSEEIEIVPIYASFSDLPTPKRFWADQVRLPRIAKSLPIDLLHQTAFSCPIFYKKAPKVLTVHDLIPLLFPENFKSISRFFWRYFFPFSIKQADFIITVSNSTKKDLVRYLSIKETKIGVTYLGVNLEKYRPKKVAGTPPYLLFVSTLELRKQPLMLLKIAKALIKRGFPHRIKIVGKRGWKMEDFDDYLKAHPEIQERVDYLNYVSEEEKIALYQGAELFLFPSLYEGFGLPPLEAMACGIPVLASDTSSLPEVIGEAGILLPPKDENLWVEKVIEILKSEKLRNLLREKGLKRVKLFSWKKCAEETERIYRRIYEGRNRY